MTSDTLVVKLNKDQMDEIIDAVFNSVTWNYYCDCGKSFVIREFGIIDCPYCGQKWKIFMTGYKVDENGNCYGLDIK